MIEKTIESEVSSVLAQLVGLVASQIEDVTSTDSSSPTDANSLLTCTLSPNDLSSQLEKFNELTDDQLLDIRITECHTTILNWVNPNPYKKLKTK